MVLKVGRSELDDWLASSQSNNNSIELGRRQNACPRRPASDELFRYRTMDGVSTIRADHASDNNKLWNDDRLSRVEGMVNRKPVLLVALARWCPKNSAPE